VIQLFCPKCNTEFDDSSAFCPNCGTKKASIQQEGTPLPPQELKGRTVRKFSWQGQNDVLEIVNSWASQQGYRRKSTAESPVLYQHGSAFWAAWPPHVLQVSWSDNNYSVEAWVLMHPLHVLNHLMYPTEMVLDSGPEKAEKARAKARDEVNVLLQALGQLLIT
jgi:zinc-ribbon domain